jgi:hypothetical protein
MVSGPLTELCAFGETSSSLAWGGGGFLAGAEGFGICSTAGTPAHARLIPSTSANPFPQKSKT